MTNTFEEIFKFLDDVPKDIRVRVKRVFSKLNVSLLLSELQYHSPEDTGDYKENWKVDRTRYTDKTVIAGLRIYNDTPYAHAMEFGGTLGGSPWPWYPRIRTGKLVDFSGKVWAGGLKPGHGKTIGGAISIVSKKHRDFRFLAKEIADGIVKGWQ